MKLSATLGLMFLVAASPSIIRGPPRLVMDGYRRHHLLNAGETLRLGCPVDSDDGVRSTAITTWYKDGDEVSVGWERYRVRHDALYVRDAERDDSGVYVCRATNGFGSVDVKYLVLVLAGNESATPPSDFDEDYLQQIGGLGEAPSFVHNTAVQSDDEYVELAPGGGATLSCRAVGRPRPEVRWYKDDRRLAAHDNGWIIVLDDVRRHHGGRYTCHVTNRLGSVSRTYIVHVADYASEERPLFVPAQLENLTVVQGQTAILVCRVYGDLTTRLQWRRDEEVPDGKLDAGRVTQNVSVDAISDDPVRRRHQQNEQQQQQQHYYYTSTLSLRRSVTDDTGPYLCSATNSHGFVERRTFLRVLASERGSDDGGMDGVVGWLTLRDSYLSVVVPVSFISAVIVVVVIVCVVCRRRPCVSKLPPTSSSSLPQSSSTACPAAATSSVTTTTYVPAAVPATSTGPDEYTRCFVAPRRLDGTGVGWSGAVAGNGEPSPALQHGGLIVGPRQPLMPAPPPQRSDVHYHFYDHC